MYIVSLRRDFPLSLHHHEHLISAFSKEVVIVRGYLHLLRAVFVLLSVQGSVSRPRGGRRQERPAAGREGSG